MDDFPTLSMTPTPTAQRPLLGLTVLGVEDSRFASDALRLMCLRLGARIRRADSLASAERHLRVYRPTVVIIDIGLPDGSGLDLVETLAEARPRPPVLLATSGDATTRADALSKGADGFIEKPATSLAAFQTAILAHLPREQHPAGPRSIPREDVKPDPIALRDDMEHAADLLDGDVAAETLAYVSQFVTGLCQWSGDTALAQAAADLASPDKTATAIPRLRSLLGAHLAKPLAV